ncbi:MAG: DUF58 domain-containing protein [Lachnospiraceae bacterium]|nr:DUF58 domain-containing protein [Lachnospiraceae bacterium]
MEKRLHLSPWGILRFCILFGITLYLWNFFRSYFLFLVLLLMACGSAASFLLLWFSRDKLRAQVVLPAERVGRNAEFFFTVKVHNSGKIASFTADITYSWSNIFTGYSERKKQRLWVAPGEGGEIKLRLSSRYAGRVEVRIEALEIFDLFHMFCLRGCDRSDAYVIVWPAFTETDGEELQSCVEDFPQENETKKRGVDYNPDYEIREYIPGDELKSIHWKLSAKQKELMVRERLATGRDKINVLLPLLEDRELNDGLMEAADSLCRLLLHKEYPVQLYWPGRGDILQGRFVAEQGELENVLSEILSDNGLHRVGAAETQMAVEHPGESYILIRTGAYKGAYIR